MKKAVAICAVAAIVLSASFIYTSLGQAEYKAWTGNYTTYEYTAVPEPEFPYPIINYSVSRSSSFVRLFDEIAIHEFASGVPYRTTPTTNQHIDDFGELVIHETPTSAMEFTAIEDNHIQLYLAGETGAIKSGNSVVIGNEDAKGYFMTRGGVNVTISDTTVSFNVKRGGGLIFRADPEGEQVIGEATSKGRVAGEMYISTDGELLVEDIVLYDELAMQTVSPGSKEIDLSVSGSAGSKAVVVHVDKSMLEYDSPDEIGIRLGETYITRGEGLSETLYESGEEAKYFVAETDAGYDVVVYIPDISNHIITIGSVQEEIGIDGFATFLSAVAIVGIAAAALVYNKD